MTPGDYKTAGLSLINSKYSTPGEPTFRSKPVGGSGYSGGGSNNRGGYSMGKHGAAYSKNKASTYGKGFGNRSAGTEGRSKSKYS